MGEFIFKKPEFNPQPIFQSTSPVEVKKSNQQRIQTAMLIPFQDHPFKICTGQRYADLLESIKLNGILQPLLVRPHGENQYEIMAGHNRYECAKELGLPEVPVVIMDVDDEEAMFIVIETNLYQRSFTDLSHSERARALAVHIEANKRQGRRTDLINEVKNLLKTSDDADCGTLRPVGEKLNTTKEVAEKYELSSRQITRYLRIDKLSQGLKLYIDDERIAIRSGVELSYLSVDEQKQLECLLDTKKYKIDMKQALLLRNMSEQKCLDVTVMEQILSGTYKPKKRMPAKRKPITLSPAIVSKYFGTYTQDKQVVEVIGTSLDIYTENQVYFSEEQTVEEIKDIYRKALTMYFDKNREEETELE